MKTIQGKIDDNDLLYITERFGVPELAKPAPWKNGRPHFQSTRFLLKNGNYVDVCHVKPIYYEAIDETFRPLSEILTKHGNIHMILAKGWEDKVHPRFLKWLISRQELMKGSLLIPSLYRITDKLGVSDSVLVQFTTTTVYPNAHTETVSYDATVGRSVTSETWATIQAGAGNYASDNDAGSAALFPAFVASGTSGQYGALFRGITLFDTSGIGTDNISDATLSIYGTDKTNPGTNPSWGVYSATTSSNTAASNSDYQACGTTDLATAIAYASFNNAGYNDYSLNASGISNINKTGISKFSQREATYDATGTAPTWGSGWNTHYYAYQAEYTGTTRDPKLVITHAAGGGGGSPTPTLMLMGIGT